MRSSFNKRHPRLSTGIDSFSTSWTVSLTAWWPGEKRASFLGWFRHVAQDPPIGVSGAHILALSGNPSQEKRRKGHWATGFILGFRANFRGEW